MFSFEPLLRHATTSFSEEKDPKILILKRDYIIDAVSRFQTFVFSENLDIDELKRRFFFIEDANDVFDALQRQIEILQPNRELHNNTRALFEDSYYPAAGRADKILKAHQKTPKIDLPKFSGGIHEWMYFFDAFNTKIHLNDSLTNAEKLRYLQWCLTGKARDSLSENYTATWNSLQDAYNKNRVLIQKRVKAIVEMPVMEKSAEGVKNFVDTFEENIRALKDLGYHSHCWDGFIIMVLTKKLDYDTVLEWNTPAERNPDFKDLIAILKAKHERLSKTD